MKVNKKLHSRTKIFAYYAYGTSVSLFLILNKKLCEKWDNFDCKLNVCISMANKYEKYLPNVFEMTTTAVFHTPSFLTTFHNNRGCVAPISLRMFLVSGIAVGLLTYIFFSSSTRENGPTASNPVILVVN